MKPDPSRRPPRHLSTKAVAALCLGLVVTSSLLTMPAIASTSVDQPGKRADFRGESSSREVQQVAEWVLAEFDNQGLPFIVIDKINARVFAFDATGLLRGTAPVLLGLARGDESPAGIGNRSLSTILPGERITPAGRFVTTAGVNLANKDILWIDYDSALSLHPVVTSNAREQRLQRLESASALDNRISYGCINVPADFYKTVIKDMFGSTSGITYILPDHKSIHDVLQIPRQPHQNP